MKNRFILIDDENAHNLICRINIGKVFKEAEVVSFTYPPDGVAYIKKEGPANLQDTVLLLDLNMPIMDGFEVLDEMGTFLRSRNEENLQIFVLSSTINDDEIKRSIGHTLVKGFIEKPLTSDKIEDLFLMVKADA